MRASEASIITEARTEATSTSACKEPSLQTWLSLMRVYEKMQKHAGEHLECYDLSPAQYDVLAQLQEAPGISQQELAERLEVTKGNVCTLLDRMQDRDLVVRERHPADRRLHLLYLTEKGATIAVKAIPAYAQFVREHLKTLSAAEQAQLLGLLGRLESHLDTH
jgi:DNA-binding MarR family transcriptional regulator